MNTTSLELSKELYELSHWDLDDDNDTVYDNPDDNPFKIDGVPQRIIPAYDLGYLLRKLVTDDQLVLDYIEIDFNGVNWRAYVKQDFGKDELFETADTPEDCAAKLAIELFRQGVLKR